MCVRENFSTFSFQMTSFPRDFLKMLPPNRPLPSNFILFYFIIFNFYFFYRPQAISKVAIMNTKRGSIAFFSLLLLSSSSGRALFPFSLFLLLCLSDLRAYRAFSNGCKFRYDIFQKFYYSETCIKRTPLGNAVVSA